MNKPIRTVSIFCLLLFLALALNATYLQYYHASALNNRVGNGRVATATFSRDRGAIMVGRTAVAESVKTKDQYKVQRVYPQPFMYAPVTGWYTFGNETGIERTQNSYLSGEDDSLFVNRLVDLVNGNATKGANVLLTIDPAAQKAAFDGLRALGSDVQGAVVAIEPSTGKILAVVSLPTYNPNRLATHDFKKASAYASRLSKLRSQPLLNRAVQTTLAPGSTFKVVTATAALDTGKATPETIIDGSSPKEISGVPLENSGGEDFGPISFTDALTNSVNTVFAQVGEQVGRDTLVEYMKRYGFFADPELDYPDNQMIPSGIRRNGTQYVQDGFDAGRVAIGQGGSEGAIEATPMQMAEVAAAIANKGRLMKPRLTDRIVRKDGRVKERIEPDLQSEVMKPETAAALTEMMGRVVEEGTGTAAALSGIRVAGKTGTAEVGANREFTQPWFICFAPIDNPKLAVAVTVERQPAGSFGGVVAAPIAKSVLETMLGGQL
jgi:peptidoglycan glycosyltransferase